jgi:hypothetical protein
MNLVTVKGKARAKKTFYKNQLFSERMILYYYYSNHRDTILTRELITALNQERENVVYPPYNSRKKKLSEEQQRKAYVEQRLRKVISAFIGPAESSPPKEIMHFANHTSDHFGEYITALRKSNGAIYQPGSYKGYRSGLSYLQKRYKFTATVDFTTELTDLMTGVQRHANQAKQVGEGKIEDGVRPLSLALYKQINRWFVEDGSKEAIYSRAFATKTWNLACRGDSTGRVMIDHLKWAGDCVATPFAHSKEEQTGADRRKRLPRHCFANPLEWEPDYMSSIFEYLATFPEILANPKGPLFPGSDDAQGNRFLKYLRKILSQHQTELEETYGFKIEDVGVHSYRKGAHTYMNSGSTAGPSAAATCIRGGHTMGSVRDIYVLQEKAGDAYCGRLLTGLPVNRPEFAMSHPDFVPDLVGISDDEAAGMKAALHAEAKMALECIFGAEQLRKIPTLIPVLRVGLASSLHHHKKTNEVYPQTSPIRFSPLHTSSAIRALEEKVKISMPWEDGGRAYLDATGVPPHTLMLVGNENILQAIKGIVPSMERAMDDRTMNGILSETRIREIVMNNETMVEMRREMRLMRLSVEAAMAGGTLNNTGANQGAGPGDAEISASNRNLWSINGRFSRVPPDWIFPLGAAANVYVYWIHGDENRRISPMRVLEHCDLAWCKGDKKRYPKNLQECRFLFQMIENEVMRLGLWRDKPSRAETIDSFYKSKGVWGLSELTPGGSKRNFSKLTWTTVLKVMPREKKLTRGGTQ